MGALGVEGSQFGLRPGGADDQSRAFQRAIDETARNRTPLAIAPGSYRVGNLKLPANAQLVGVRELPVVEHGRVVGIVAKRDLDPYVGHFEWTTVRTAMTPDPVTVQPDMPASEVAYVLVSRQINAVPVASAGSLIGMISRHDLLRLLIPSE